MGELSKLPNIGKEIERQLNEVGITTYDQLKLLGTEKSWLKIQQIDESACIHRLMALEGALQGVKKTLLTDKRKSELKEFYNLHKKQNLGIGKALLSTLAQIAIERDCKRLDWWCLDWNKSSIEFYKKMGAVPMDEWTVYRVENEALANLADLIKPPRK